MAEASIHSDSAPVFEALERFRPVQSKFEYRLLEYGPLFVLAQFNATGIALILLALYNTYHPRPQLITWAIGYLYAGVLLALLAESIAVRAFLRKIALTFRQLWDGGSLEFDASGHDVAHAFVAFLEEYQSRLNSRERLWLGLPFAGLGLAFFWISGHLPHTLALLTSTSDLVTKLTALVMNGVALFFPGTVVGYLLGIGSWKTIITGIYVRRFSRSFDLVVQTDHPDNAGGLRPLGSLMLAMSAILIISSLALSGLTIYADLIDFRVTRVFSRVFLALAVVLSLVSFFLPLIGAHERMVEERSRLQPFLVRISKRIAELDRSTRIDLEAMDHNRRTEVFSEIDSLKELYNRTLRTPTWPFDRDIFLRFLTPQVVSLLSLVGMAEPIAKAIRSLLFSINGGAP